MPSSGLTVRLPGGEMLDPSIAPLMSATDIVRHSAIVLSMTDEACKVAMVRGASDPRDVVLRVQHLTRRDVEIVPVDELALRRIIDTARSYLTEGERLQSDAARLAAPDPTPVVPGAGRTGPNKASLFPPGAPLRVPIGTPAEVAAELARMPPLTPAPLGAIPFDAAIFPLLSSQDIACYSCVVLSIKGEFVRVGVKNLGAALSDFGWVTRVEYLTGRSSTLWQVLCEEEFDRAVATQARLL